MTENMKKYKKNVKMTKRTHRCTPRGTCLGPILTALVYTQQHQL